MSFLILMGCVMAIVGVISLSLIGLFTLPWQVLLLFLLGVWGVTQWLLVQNQKPIEARSEENSTTAVPPEVTSTSIPVAQSGASLFYRGASYARATPATPVPRDATVTTVTGKYRGAIWRSWQ
jgi:hypothetical protein